MSNPKTAVVVVYASIFVSLLPREIPTWVMLVLPLLVVPLLVLPLLVFAIETGWYCVVALALCAPSPRAAYLRSRKWVDRAAGGVMAVLGIKIMVGARPL